MSAHNQNGSASRHSAIQRVAGMSFDGASDRDGPAGSPRQGSRHGSVSGSQAGGSQRGGTPGSPGRLRSGSTAGGNQSSSPPKSGPGGFPMGTGVDPAFDPNDPKSSRQNHMTESEFISKRVDLPAEAFRTVSFSLLILYMNSSDSNLTGWWWDCFCQASRLQYPREAHSSSAEPLQRDQSSQWRYSTIRRKLPMYLHLKSHVDPLSRSVSHQTPRTPAVWSRRSGTQMPCRIGS